MNIISIEEVHKYSLAGKNILDSEVEFIDLEHLEEELSYTWQTILHHDAYAHPELENIEKITSTF